jgi:hypothetical protein
MPDDPGLRAIAPETSSFNTHDGLASFLICWRSVEIVSPRIHFIGHAGCRWPLGPSRSKTKSWWRLSERLRSMREKHSDNCAAAWGKEEMLRRRPALEESIGVSMSRATAKLLQGPINSTVLRTRCIINDSISPTTCCSQSSSCSR